MTRNEKYWIDRANRRMDKYVASAFDEARIINRAYNGLKTYIDGEMAKILRHIGDEDSLAYEYRMKRLNALLKNTDEKFKELYNINLGDTTAFLKSIIPEAYYHTIFDIAQGIGTQPEFSAVNSRLINKIIHEDWSGENYSKRIWKNTNKLAEEVREVLTEAATNGESIYKTSAKVADKFNTSAYNAERLIRTETTYATNQAEMLAYDELEIEKYEFVATLDTRTSPICQKMDGKVFETKEAQAGKNLPAMHPNCRSTTIPYFKDGMPTVRTARDKDGNRITVPANMKYDEWYDKYIEPTAPKKQPKPKTEKPVEVPTVKPAEIQVSKAEKGGYVEEKIPEKKFTPAETLEEAEQYMSQFVREKTWSGDGNVSVKGLDLEAANTINKTLTDIYNEYDLPKFTNIEPMNFKKNIWKGQELTPLAYRNMSSGELFFNPKIVKNQKSLDKYFKDGEEAYQKCVRNLDKFKGDDLKTVQTYIKSGRQLIADECNDKLKALVDHEVGHHIQNQIIVANKDMIDIVNKGYEKYAINLSGYATKTKGEYIAESFSAYRNGKTDMIDPELAKIFEGLKKK